MPHKTTHTLDVPGAVLTYDVRPTTDPDADATAPILMLLGSPMGASGFSTLASHFPDRTVLTYDPRGVERSEKTDGSLESTPELHAEDISRVVADAADQPVDLFATSGGAVNALALVARYPEQVRTLVAHEPPLAALLPDREAALAVARDQICPSVRSRAFGWSSFCDSTTVAGRNRSITERTNGRSEGIVTKAGSSPRIACVSSDSCTSR